MSEVTVVNGQINVNNITALDVVREEYKISQLKTGEIEQRYADAMNGAFGFGWWAAKGEVKKAVKVEHQKYVAMGLDDLKWSRSQVDKYWSEIKDKAGRPKSAGTASGGTTVDDANIRDLKTMLNRIEGAEPESCPLSTKVTALLVQAADLMGIDTSKLAIAD